MLTHRKLAIDLLEALARGAEPRNRMVGICDNLYLEPWYVSGTAAGSSRRSVAPS